MALAAALLPVPGHASSLEPGKGLQVTFALARSVWPEGSVLELTATLTNVSDQPLMVDLFGGVNELYHGKRTSLLLPSCWTLVWQPEHSVPAAKRGRAPLDTVDLVRLAPGESVSKSLRAALEGIPAGSYRVQLAYAPRWSSPSFSIPSGWSQQHHIVDPLWEGLIFSNELLLEISRSTTAPN